MKATKLTHEFDAWFSREYQRIRERLTLSEIFDADAFHDAYLVIRQGFKGMDIDNPDFQKMFNAAYKRIRGKQVSETFTLCRPDDLFFILLPTTDPESEEQALEPRDSVKIVCSIRRHVKKSYPEVMAFAWEHRYLYDMQLKSIMEITGLGYGTVKESISTIDNGIRAKYAAVI